MRSIKIKLPGEFSLCGPKAGPGSLLTLHLSEVVMFKAASLSSAVPLKDTSQRWGREWRGDPM